MRDTPYNFREWNVEVDEADPEDTGTIVIKFDDDKELKLPLGEVMESLTPEKLRMWATEIEPINERRAKFYKTFPALFDEDGKMR